MSSLPKPPYFPLAGPAALAYWDINWCDPMLVGAPPLAEPKEPLPILPEPEPAPPVWSFSLVYLANSRSFYNMFGSLKSSQSSRDLSRTIKNHSIHL